MKRIIKVIKGNKKSITVILVATLTIILTTSYLVNLRKQSEYIANESINEQMQQSNIYVSKYINKKVNYLNNLKSIIQKIDLSNSETIRTYISDYCDQSEFESFTLTNNGGDLIYGFEIPKNYIKKAYNSFINNSEDIFISEPIKEKISSKDVMYFSVPVLSNDTVAGIFTGRIQMQKIQEELLSDMYDNKGYFYVISKDGTIIFRSKSSIEEAKNYTNLFDYMNNTDSLVKVTSKIINDSVDKKSNIIKLKINGIEEKISYKNVSENNNWEVVHFFEDDKFVSYSSFFGIKVIGLIIGSVLIIFICSLYIISQEKNKQKMINKISSTDQLTQLCNENYFFEEGKEILTNNLDKKFIIAVMDIKNFKYINHNYGYSFGDEILKIIANTINNKYNNKYSTCCRVNGDIFMILGEYNNDFHEELYSILCNSIDDDLNTNKIKLDFYIGLYVIRNNEGSIVSMCDKANIALKYVKNNIYVRNIKYFDDELLEKLIEEKELENKMEEALNSNEFKVYIQPKVSLNNNSMCGAEALVRWISKDLGFLSPDRFIPLFEKNGFIKKVDFYVLEKVCERQKYFVEQGMKTVPISVNQSRVTIDDENYISDLKKVLAKYNIDPKLIELEVTESVFMGNYKKILGVMREIKEIGFILSMDDFGSGYSSLNLLKEMPINVLKIDREFLNETSTSNRSRIIIKSVINMAKDLDIEVVCEGVETKEQVVFLKEIKCQTAQGYYYEKPIPMEEFEERNKNNEFLNMAAN